MKLVIFGGTTEGRVLSHRLAERGDEVTVCVATEYGGEAEGGGPGLTVLTGPKSMAEKRELLRDAAFCVDATHPYAGHIRESVRAACEAAGVPYRRLLRGSGGKHGGVTVENAAEAAAYLRERPGNVLLTTGAKELPAFGELDRERLAARVLPARESLAACEAAGILKKNIVAMQGPFSEELNAALLRHFDARWLVTKDGGAAGGFPEKVRAAERCGVGLIVLRRPEDAGGDMETIFNEIEKVRTCR